MRISTASLVTVLALSAEASVMDKRMQKESKFALTDAKRTKYENYLNAHNEEMSKAGDARPHPWMKFVQAESPSFRLADNLKTYRVPAEKLYKSDLVNVNPKLQQQVATEICFDPNVAGLQNATQYKTVNVVVVNEVGGLNQVWCFYSSSDKIQASKAVDLEKVSDGVVASLVYTADNAYDKWLAEEYKKVKNGGLPSCNIQ